MRFLKKTKLQNYFPTFSPQSIKKRKEENYSTLSKQRKKRQSLDSQKFLKEREREISYKNKIAKLLFYFLSTESKKKKKRRELLFPLKTKEEKTVLKLANILLKKRERDRE